MKQRATSYRDSITMALPPMVLNELYLPNFTGEILDIRSLDRYRTGVIFPDSLVIFNLLSQKGEPDTTIKFSASLHSPVISRVITGDLNSIQSDSLNRSGASVVTSNFKMPQRLRIDHAAIEKSGSVASQLPSWALSNWSVLPGRALYGAPFPDGLNFRDLIDFPRDSVVVILDELGFLRGFNTSTRQQIWSSGRPWGNSLNRLYDNTFAVYDGIQHSFILAEIEEGAFGFVGQSREFTGSVTAVAPVSVMGQPGYLIGIYNRTTNASHLEYIRDNQIVWKTPIHYSRPLYPDYDVTLSLLQQEEQPVFSSSANYIPYALWPDLFEAPFSVRDGTVTPLLAKNAIANQSYNLWTIHLRTDIRFSDNTPLNAATVIRSWEDLWSQCQPDSCSLSWLLSDIDGMDAFWSGEHSSITGIRALNDSTIRIRLNQPLPEFQRQLAHPIFSVKRVSQKGYLPVGTGAYQVTSIFTDSMETRIHAQRNPYYHNGYPRIAQFEYRVQNQTIADSLINAPNFGVIARRQKDIEYLSRLKKTKLYQFPRSELYFVAINPFSDSLQWPDQRALVVSSLDRGVTANIITEAACTPAGSLTGETEFSVNAPHDTTAAKFSAPLSIAYKQNDIIARQIAERLAARLSQKQIPHRPPEGLSTSVFRQRRLTGGYDVLIDKLTPDFSSPRYIIKQLLQQGYAVPEEIQTAEKNILAHDDNQALLLEKLLIQGGVIFPVLNTANYALLPPELRSIRVAGTSTLHLEDAWIPHQ